MNHMHPQDLRAIISTLLIVSDPSIPSHAAIEFADVHLAEMERTAKPEPATLEAEPETLQKWVGELREMNATKNGRIEELEKWVE